MTLHLLSWRLAKKTKDLRYVNLVDAASQCPYGFIVWYSDVAASVWLVPSHLSFSIAIGSYLMAVASWLLTGWKQSSEIPAGLMDNRIAANALELCYASNCMIHISFCTSKSIHEWTDNSFHLVTLSLSRELSVLQSFFIFISFIYLLFCDCLGLDESDHVECRMLVSNNE